MKTFVSTVLKQYKTRSTTRKILLQLMKCGQVYELPLNASCTNGIIQAPQKQGLEKLPVTLTNIFTRGVQGVTVHHPISQGQILNAHYYKSLLQYFVCHTVSVKCPETV